MRYPIILTVIGALTMFTSGCGLTVNVAFATPSITPVIATSIPVDNPLPTLTPLPSLAPATATTAPIAPTGPTSTATTQPTETTAPTASVTASPIVPTQTRAPTQTQPPPPPTQVVLPQLPVFDKDGNNMEGKALGTALARTYMSFQVVACEPDCKTKPDGNGVTSIDFSFYKGTYKLRDDVDGKTPVYQHTENNHPYCAFGGDDPCPLWIFAAQNNKWPNGANIDNGNYTLLMNAQGKNNGLWTSVLNFTIQR